MVERVCINCGKIDILRFYRSTLCKRCNNIQWRHNNPEKIQQENKQWKHDNPEKVKQNRIRFYASNPERAKQVKRECELIKNYNITIEEYDKMLIEQSHSCAICKRHESEFKKRLSVDHCHVTGKIRGLLCVNCNTVIGHLQDNKQILLNAVEYLK